MSIINASPEKMRAFATYVSEFSTNVLDDCEELESATKKLASSMSADEMKTIESMVNKIEMILHAATPVFQKLDGALNIYANYVDEARKRANGG